MGTCETSATRSVVQHHTMNEMSAFRPFAFFCLDCRRCVSWRIDPLPRARAGEREDSGRRCLQRSPGARGAAVYDGACGGCHRADLAGGPNGPSLREERFARVFAGKDLKTLFTKTATTMPRGAPASLGDNVYLDIVAHLLKENGFRPVRASSRPTRSTASASCRDGPSRRLRSAISPMSKSSAASAPALRTRGC